MADRRNEILDTALHVLAEHGMRGLTHRAVDAGAGLPLGSTSYYFRTRDALIAGCLHRLLELDRADLPPAAAVPIDLDAMVDTATRLCVAMVGVGAHRTLARYELSLYAVRVPRLRAELVEAGTTLRHLGAEQLAGLGVPDAMAASEELMAAIDGLVYTALLRGPHDPDALRAWFGTPIRRLLSTHLEARP